MSALAVCSPTGACLPFCFNGILYGLYDDSMAFGFRIRILGDPQTCPEPPQESARNPCATREARRGERGSRKENRKGKEEGKE